MAFSTIFIDTPGRPTAFFDTPTPALLFDTSGRPTAFVDTPTLQLFADTSGKPTAFVDTPTKEMFADTSGRPTAFADTFGRDEAPILELKFSTITIESDCSSLTFTDGTGVDPTDPTGYFPESGTGNNPLVQPKRSEVDLWWVWSDYTRNLKMLTFPATQDESFVVPTPEKGIYILSLIAVPTGTDWGDYDGEESLITLARETDGWFVSQAGVLVDCSVNACVNRARWKHVKALMGRNCYDEYKQLYTLINAITQALRVQRWAEAFYSYERLKELCVATGCNECGC